MVDLTIYVEGGAWISAGGDAALTIDNSQVFREGFHKLFSQKLSEDHFNLIIQPIGSVTQTRNYLQKLSLRKNAGIILIDLDGPKSEKGLRLEHYKPLDTSRLFFMVQEMESWILSQPEILSTYAKFEGLNFKKPDENLSDDSLIKNIHPEEISNPSEKLNTLFRKYFSELKIRGGKPKPKAKSYSKSKDGPRLIGLLNLDSIITDFDEAERLISFVMIREIKSQND
ncbi:MAG: hypothetical protein H6581_20945 [Bacteroidia bacterium]|nr:hypothetical protein [Bacteroidia bacterium]